MENLETVHRSKEIRAVVIDSSRGRDSGQCHIVVAKGRCIGTHWVKVCVCHGLLSSQTVLQDRSVWTTCTDVRTTYSMVVAQKLVKEVNGLVTDETLVLSVHK